jgi:hypothetical protein
MTLGDAGLGTELETNLPPLSASTFFSRDETEDSARISARRDGAYSNPRFPSEAWILMAGIAPQTGPPSTRISLPIAVIPRLPSVSGFQSIRHPR